jgi:hypothetical protein
MVKVGASLTSLTLMVKVCSAVVSFPSFSIPPLSFSLTVTVAVPLLLSLDLKVRLPSGVIVGWFSNKSLLSLVTSKLRVCSASSTGPLERLLAQPTISLTPKS